MLGLIVSTIAYFVASHYIKRWADDNGFPKGMTRGMSIFIGALAVAYAFAWVVDALAALIGL